MILSKIIIYNYRVFYKRNVIDTRVDPPDRNIILIGGRNGRGKTSILEAIKICLYGGKNDDIWHPKDAYYRWIKENFNRKAWLEGDRELYIELILESEDVRPKEIRLRRSYKIDGENIDERFEIFENNVKLDMPPEDLEDYVSMMLLPREWMSFFLFDGEMIKKLADEIEYKERAILENIKKLLGVGYYEYIVSDIKQVQKDILKEMRDKDVQNLIAQKEAEINQRRNDIEKLEKEKRLKIEEMVEIEGRVEDIDNELKRLGYGGIKRVEEIDRRIEEIKEELEDKRSQLRNYMKDDFPILILNQLIREFLQVLDREWETLTKLEAIRGINIEAKEREFENWLKEELKKYIGPDLIDEVIKRILAQFNLKWREMFNIELNDSEIIFAKHISKEYYQFIKELPAQVQVSPLKVLLDEISHLERELIRLRREKNKLPEKTEHIERLMNEKDNLNQELGKLKKEIENIDAKIERLQREIESLEREIHRLNNKLRDYPELDRLYNLAEKVKETLEKYISTLLDLKRKEFEELLTENFKELFYKKREIDKIIVKEDFSIEIMDPTGGYIRKDKLSAGEKQILALAILKTLEELTGRTHFVVIDTPMGRLDDQYKRLLVEKLFPSLSNQTILLSTPEEIRGSYYDSLSKYISKEYTLEYKDGLFHSELLEGYFRG
ncbi:DNA sulfur modification protein DndD [Archaeoglobus sp.]